MPTDLTGRTALVCGASSGIGRAAAQVLASQGASVIALARREAELDTLLAELAKISTPHARHRKWVCDLSQREPLAAQLDELLAVLAASGDGIDIFVANASGPAGGAIQAASEEAFLNTFQVHLLVNHFLVTKILPSMKSREYGRIINVISTSVKAPLPGLGVSNTIRAAVASWAKTLAQEVAQHGITVNSVLPGYTKTPRLAELLKAAALKRGVSEDEVAQEWLKSVPAARFGEPEEVARAIGFLASPAAAYINGVALAVDGGRTPCL